MTGVKVDKEGATYIPTLSVPAERPRVATTLFGPRLLTYVCTSRAQEKLHRTWDGSTEVSPRPGVPAVVWTGASRTTPLDAGPHSDTDPDPIPWPTRCSTVRSPTRTPGNRFQNAKIWVGGTLRGSAGQWVGGRAKTGKLPKHWRRKQKLRRGTTSVCTSRAQEKLHRTWVFTLR